jgi:hypothetical protein
MQSVTILHAEFRTELVVNLYSGWIAQLADASFPGTLIISPFWLLKKALTSTITDESREV